mmetsp:Transcript_89755/g.169062  ORF Transcript_89755/g.169062 Transcript_89755/m.169062 type:complete len:704 (-) Transcript_89755:135-2246(-)
MSGSFRDSFTRDDTKEDLLGYDDTAFYYFAISMLTCMAVPWTFSLIRNLLFPRETQIEHDFPVKSSEGSTFRYCQVPAMIDKVERRRKEAQKWTPRLLLWWAVKASVLISIWVGIFAAAAQLGDEKDIKKFDPFDILDVSAYATITEIKKSYRKLSLLYHPDKNPDNPLAASRFIQISKAFQALTDDNARRNFEKYGNPDGPQTTRVGIGFPKFLLEKENSFMNLCAFFFLILFIVPVTFFCYFQQTKNYVANGVMVDTLQFLGYYVGETTRMRNCPELLAACSESRGMGTRPSDKEHVATLQKQVTEHKKRSFTLPIIIKNQCLIWAHLQRKHHLMTPELREDLDILLGHSMKITQAMIEIACMREWFVTAQAMIEFRRCLVQALDVKMTGLLQVPHFTPELLEPHLNSKAAMPVLSEFVKLDRTERQVFLSAFPRRLEPQELLDIDMFCSHVSHLELTADISVEDEQEIAVGDVATVTVQMSRSNLRENEAMGPVHSPYFPEPKFEEWWIFLVDGVSSTRRQQQIVHFERVCDQERFVEQKLRFQVTRPGKNHMLLYALCDAYAGVDKMVELHFDAFTEEEVKREYRIHEADEMLDLQPTLFQQWMGDIRTDEESEEEEEEEFSGFRRAAHRPAAPSATAAKGVGMRQPGSAEPEVKSKASAAGGSSGPKSSTTTGISFLEAQKAGRSFERESSDSSSGSE